MRIVSYRRGDAVRAGISRPEGIYDVAHALESAGLPPLDGGPSVRSLLRAHGADLRIVDAAVNRLVESGESPIANSDAELTPPVPDPGKILCIGLNYKDHVAETGRKLPEYPDVFPKYPATLIGPRDEIGGRDVTDQLDFEGELAIVIGRDAKAVSAEDALDHVAGVMILNDVTARDLQYRGTQWLMGKAVDGTTPCGPEIVTLDEVGDIQALELSTTVNGVEMQRSNTRHMIFPIARIIEYVSRTLGLEAGDIIATGTPEGIGAKRTPPVWLRPGDTISITIERVGTMTNTVAF